MNYKPILVNKKKSNHLTQQIKNPQFQVKNWENSIISLSKVLNNLNDDTLKRYNTQVDRYSQQKQSIPKNDRKQNKLYSQKQLKLQTQNHFQILQPEPWFNDNQINKSSKSKNYKAISKSFHIMLPSNNQKKKYSTKQVRSLSSVYAFPTYQNKQQQQTFSKINTTLQQNQKLLTQHFNYTNEQKARVSLQFLTHEKKHKKMQKILKYKAHFMDKTGFKQQKITQHTKYLVETLKKLSVDNFIPPSCIQFGQGLKKRNSMAIQANIRLNTFNTFNTQPKQQKLQKQIKSSSCCQLETLNQLQAKAVRKKSKLKYSVKKLDPEFKIYEQFNQKNQYKVSFKPRRNWIFDKKPMSISQKKIITQHNSMTRLSDKLKSISNHFLKINKLKI